MAPAIFPVVVAVVDVQTGRGLADVPVEVTLSDGSTTTLTTNSLGLAALPLSGAQSASMVVRVRNVGANDSMQDGIHELVDEHYP
ncbi:MAG: hypothetical protein JW751_30655 [Polyangiaceae bacterium]|nr:hypothetical protein [Polyangiaceae bacterium]